MEQALNKEFLQSCINQLIEQGDVNYQDGLYSLTESGRKKVIKEMQRYMLRPGMMVLFQMWYAEGFGLQMR
ncbi:hypothetical protein [Gorillibacterium sp. sgz5001074]|uniref:hypothetical protein n=1 Tax=Gorillibacterium sp. sgz5001074 TaxID=3446695 RepID=UPI003F67DFE2